MTRQLPPGVTSDAFEAAIRGFADAVGAENVITDAEGLAVYRDPYTVHGPNANVAAAAVAPGSTEEVQAVVRVASATGVPISVISTGKNLGYGAGAPRLSGSVVLDLGKRMNRIIEVNEQAGYAVVEPGVRFFDLYEHLQKTNSRYWLSTADLGWGSVLGNALERGGGYTPFGNHFSHVAGLEVVLPDGDVIRTGPGAMPDSGIWHVFPAGYGPYLDGMFTQSNYGIVTRLGMQLMPAPPGSRTYLITFDKLDDLEAVIGITNRLVMSMQFQNLPILRDILLDGGVQSKKSEWFDGSGPLPDDAIEEMKRELGLGHWNMYFTLYGPVENLDAQAAGIWSQYKDIPGAKFYSSADRHDRGGHVLQDRQRISSGVPSLEELSLLEWFPNAGHISFAPASPADGAKLLEWGHFARDLAREYGVDTATLAGPFGRACLYISLILFDTTSEDERGRALALAKRLIKEAAARGYGEFRTHNALMDDVAATYNWNDNAILRFQEKLKDAIDPAGILAPGKSGIWPARFRGLGL